MLVMNPDSPTCIESRMLYIQQRNYCASFFKKAKIRYYANHNEKKILDNKQFRKIVIPLFPINQFSGDKTNSTENAEHVKTEMKTAENSFSTNIVSNLKIPQYSDFDPIVQSVEDPTLKVIVKYKNQTLKMKFLIQKLKASQFSDIPAKIIKENVDVFADFLSTSVNNFTKSSFSQSCPKFTDVTSLHKKRRKGAKGNYRPVSIS